MYILFVLVVAVILLWYKAVTLEAKLKDLYSVGAGSYSHIFLEITEKITIQDIEFGDSQLSYGDVKIELRTKSYSISCYRKHHCGNLYVFAEITGKDCTPVMLSYKQSMIPCVVDASLNSVAIVDANTGLRDSIMAKLSNIVDEVLLM